MDDVLSEHYIIHRKYLHLPFPSKINNHVIVNHQSKKTYANGRFESY